MIPCFFYVVLNLSVSAYKDRLTMPKYIITTSGDEFFLPDDSHYYLDQMQGKTYIRYYKYSTLIRVNFPWVHNRRFHCFIVQGLENKQTKTKQNKTKTKKPTTTTTTKLHSFHLHWEIQPMTNYYYYGATFVGNTNFQKMILVTFNFGNGMTAQILLLNLPLGLSKIQIALDLKKKKCIAKVNRG